MKSLKERLESLGHTEDRAANMILRNVQAGKLYDLDRYICAQEAMRK